jgi:uncharacterized membrane protein
MSRIQRVVQILFALGMVSVGSLVLVYGYSMLLFGPVPSAWAPWLKAVGYVSSIIMAGTGAGLLFRRTARVSIRVLLPFLLIWTASRLPVVAAEPGREISWFAVGEIAVLAAGALVLFTRLAELRAGSNLQLAVSDNGLRIARILFAVSLPTYGLSHFFEFAARTISLVPPWLPYRTGWAYLTGAAQIAAGLGVLFSVYSRWAAAMEAGLLSVFTLLVWVPAVIAKPRISSNWTEMLFTFALAGASWVVAESIPEKESGHRTDNKLVECRQGWPSGGS